MSGKVTVCLVCWRKRWEASREGAERARGDSRTPDQGGHGPCGNDPDLGLYSSAIPATGSREMGRILFFCFFKNGSGS